MTSHVDTSHPVVKAVDWKFPVTAIVFGLITIGSWFATYYVTIAKQDAFNSSIKDTLNTLIAKVDRLDASQTATGTTITVQNQTLQIQQKSIDTLSSALGTLQGTINTGAQARIHDEDRISNLEDFKASVVGSNQLVKTGKR